MQTPSTRNCISCGRPVKGRSDKKFCNDYCRNAYNNLLKSTSNNLVRNLNNRLLKNRKILEEILAENKCFIKIKKQNLEDLGFHFNYITQITKNKRGSFYYYCYEYGYFHVNKEWLVLIRNESI